MIQFGFTAKNIALSELAHTSALDSLALYPFFDAACKAGGQISEQYICDGFRKSCPTIPSIKLDAIIPEPMKPILLAAILVVVEDDMKRVSRGDMSIHRKREVWVIEGAR